MTAPSLLDELDEVVRRITDDAAEVRRTGGDPERERHTQRIAVNFIRTHHAEIADMANELRVARESFKRCDEICKCTAEGWRTAEEDMAKRLEAAERDAARYRWLRGGDSRLAVCDEDTSYYLEQLDAIVDAATQEGEG